MNENQLIVNKLHTHAKRIAIPTIPTVFFPLLHEFVAFFLPNPAFQKPLKIIMARGEEAEKHLKTFEKAGLDELKLKYIQMRKYVTNHNVPNQIVQALDTFESRFEKSDVLNRMLFVPLERALDTLLNDEQADHSNFTQTFGKINQINDDKFIRTADAFPKFDAWEKASVYFAQIKLKADWYSLNQLMVFAERYDLRYYDNLINELIKKGVDISKLQEEQQALMMYAYFDGTNSANLFPSIEEYKCHVMRLVESIAEIMTPLAALPELKEHAYFYKAETGEFMVDELSIKFRLNLKPAELLVKMIDTVKPLSFKKIFNDIKLYEDDKESISRRLKRGTPVKGDLSASENKTVRNLIKNTNARFALKSKPDFLVIQDENGSLTQKTVLKSALYKLIKSH